jgi:hypothetical protein
MSRPKGLFNTTTARLMGDPGDLRTDGKCVLVSVQGAGEPCRDGRSRLTKVHAISGGAFCAPGFDPGKLLAFGCFLIGE